MLKIAAIVLSLCFIVGTHTSCNKTPLNYTNSPSQNDNGENIKLRGTLYLVPTSLVTHGILDYTIFHDGSITWDGMISFHGNEETNYQFDRDILYYVLAKYWPLKSLPLRGAYKVDSKIISSATYAGTEREYKADHLGLNIISRDNQTVSVFAKYLPKYRRKKYRYYLEDRDATFEATFDVSRPIVRIQSVTIEGRVAYTPISIEFLDQDRRNAKSDQAPEDEAPPEGAKPKTRSVKKK